LRKSTLIAALWAVALLAALPLHLPSAMAAGVQVSNWTLANGLQLVVIPDHRAPVVTHVVWYRAGSADEPQGKGGIAHLLEHLMFKGTPTVAAGEFSRTVRRNGGEDNAFTSKDFTAYYQRIASDRLELVMTLEADRMVNLTLTDADVVPELQVVLEERRMRTDNDPSSLLSEQADAALYVAHPYRNPIIGWLPEVSRLTRDDAVAFYRAHYTPGNAIVVVAGDVDPAAVKAMAERIYGAVAAAFVPAPRVRTPEPEPIAARRVVLADARAASPTVSRDYLAPSYTTAADRQAEALDLLGEILGGGPTSRLYRDLVVDQKIAAHAGAGYGGDSADSGTFSVYVAPVPGGDVNALEAALDKALARLLKDGVSAAELARAKKALIADTVYALDSQFRLAYRYGQALTNGLTAADVADWPNRIAAVTLDDVKAAAAMVLKAERSVTGILLPDGGALATARN
jgi:zinc protease